MKDIDKLKFKRIAGLIAALIGGALTIMGIDTAYRANKEILKLDQMRLDTGRP